MYFQCGFVDIMKLCCTDPTSSMTTRLAQDWNTANRVTDIVDTDIYNNDN